MQQINDGSSRKRTLLANKIGAILSTACGTATSRCMPFGIQDDHDGALNKTQNCIALRCQQPRPIVVASAHLARKWKTSLKKVKLRLKTKTKTTASNKEPPEELCKKRILMGEKCRALNLSGVLHYDNQGILLPEAED
ncbi:hypothetical protein AAHA92_17825 [Salvia divinorum]|uniref:Uncharacterized protein n=1 Tax=Salvia divinorum TaxID=28513 RepID=A0ABD1H2W6_SALDI